MTTVTTNVTQIQGNIAIRRRLTSLLQFLWAVHKGFVTQLVPEFPTNIDEAGKKLDVATTRFTNAERMLYIAGAEWGNTTSQFQDDGEEEEIPLEEEI